MSQKSDSRLACLLAGGVTHTGQLVATAKKAVKDLILPMLVRLTKMTKVRLGSTKETTTMVDLELAMNGRWYLYAMSMAVVLGILGGLGV